MSPESAIIVKVQDFRDLAHNIEDVRRMCVDLTERCAMLEDVLARRTAAEYVPSNGTTEECGDGIKTTWGTKADKLEAALETWMPCACGDPSRFKRIDGQHFCSRHVGESFTHGDDRED